MATQEFWKFMHDAQDVRDKLLNTLSFRAVEDQFEYDLQLAAQQVDSYKADNPEVNVNEFYHRGKLDGFVECMEILINQKHRVHLFETDMVPGSVSLLKYLYIYGSKHYSFLKNNISLTPKTIRDALKKAISCSFVDYTPCDGDPRYVLTAYGKWYVQSKLSLDELQRESGPYSWDEIVKKDEGDDDE